MQIDAKSVLKSMFGENVITDYDCAPQFFNFRKLEKSLLDKLPSILQQECTNAIIAFINYHTDLFMAFQDFAFEFLSHLY